MKLSTLSSYILLVCIISSARLFATESFILLDPTGTIVACVGDVDTRLTPCSTFKIALSLMGYDMNILTNDQTPQWEFKEGYYDVIPAWRTAQTPASWIKNSCVWYSQLLAPLIGHEHIQNYLAKFDYGNQDFSGDPGKNNALTCSWLGSSLKISPREQVNFLHKMLTHRLPVSRHALDMTKNILFIEQFPQGWKLF